MRSTRSAGHARSSPRRTRSARAPATTGLAVPLERPVRRRLIASLLAGASASALMVGAASANPKNGTVVGGSATIVQTSPGQLTVTQTSDKAIINWRSFSVGAGERTVFQQPSSASVALNRVTGIDPSVILGQVSANGHIVLVNPNGIVFGLGSRVDAATLIATTTNIRNDNFLAGNYKFTEPSKSPTATVVNQGTINIADGGLAALVAPGVENAGVINARLGKVSLAAANSFTVDFRGDKLINIAVDDKVARKMLGPDGQPVAAAVSNTGKILADGGTVQITANVAKNVLDHAINMSGIVEARTVSRRGGKIILGGGDAGVVAVSGTLDASGRSAGETGGKVVILGEKIALDAGAHVDASGSAGGGTVAVGGGAQGKGRLPHAQAVYVDQAATITADALDKGDGGKVVVWSDQYTNVNGTIRARGGAKGGNGGKVETSGHKLNVGATAHVDAGAPAGRAGTWLLDPVDVTISSAATSNESGGPTFTPSANPANVNAGALNAILSGGTSVTVLTTGAGGTGNITINNAIAAGTGSATLTLTTTGAGAITIAGGSGGITGTNLSVSMTAGTGGVAFNDIVNIGGTLTVASGGAVTQTAALTVGGTSSFNAGANPITLTQANRLTGAVSLTTTGANAASLTNSIATAIGASTIGGNLTVTSTSGAISQTGALTVTGTSTFNAGANGITLGLGNSFTGAVALTTTGAGNSATLNNSGATSIGASTIGKDLTVTSGGTTSFAASTVGGNLTVNSTSGAISQSGALTVTGTSLFNAGPGNDITLTSANTLTGTVTAKGNNVSISNGAAGGLSLGSTSSAAASMTLTADTVAATGAGITVGTSLAFAPFNAGTGVDYGGGGQTLDIGTGGGGLLTKFTGFNALTVGSVSAGPLIVNAGATQNPGYALTLISGSTVTVSDAVNSAKAVTISAGGAVSMTNAANNLSSTVSLSTTAGGASLRNTVATQLGTSNVTGNLSVISGGDITQAVALTVSGNTTVAVTTGGKNIILDAANDLTGPVAFGGTDANINNLTLTNTNAGAAVPTLSTLTALKNLTLTFDTGGIALPAFTTHGGGSVTLSTTGAITQTAAATVAGTTTVASATSVALTQAGNSFGNTVALTAVGGAASVTNSGATDLGTSGVGSLTVSSGGAITQSGALTVNGAASFTATAGAINLGLNNVLKGGISLSTVAAANASLKNTFSGTNLAASTVGGTLSVTSTGGPITNTGVLNVTGTSSFDASAGPYNITLGQNNILTGAVTVKGNNVSVTDSVALTLAGGGGASNATTSLSLTSDTIATSGGVVPTGGSLSLAPYTAGTNTDYGGGGVAPFEVTPAFVAANFSGVTNLTVGSATSGNLLVNAGSTQTPTYNLTLKTGPTRGVTTTDPIDTSANNVNLTINAGNGVSLGQVTTGTGTFNVTTTTGNITQSAKLTTGSGGATFTASAGQIQLTNTSNAFSNTGSISLNNGGGNAVAIFDSVALKLGTSTVNIGANNFDVTTATGSITQSGAITTTGAGTSTFWAKDNVSPVTLTHVGNSFGGPLVIKSGAAGTTIDAMTVTLGTQTFTGDLTIITDKLTVTGAVTLNGILTIEPLSNATNTSFLGAGAVGLDVTSAAFANFTGYKNGVVIGTNAGGYTGTLVTQGSTTLMNAGLAVPLSLLAGGAITMDSLGGGNTITLIGNANFTANSSGGAVTLGGLTMGTGNVSVTAGGAVTQNGKLSSTSGGTVSISATGQTVSLTNANNAITGAISFTGADVSITDTAAAGLKLAASTATSSLTLQTDKLIAPTGTVTLTGASLTIQPNTGVSVDLGGGGATLDVSTAKLAQFSNFNALTVGSATATSLTLNSGGAQTYGAPVTSLTLISGGGVSLVDALTMTGTATLSATAGNGAISQTGAITTGTGSATFSATGGTITLANATNSFGGNVGMSTVGGFNATLVNNTSTSLGVSSVTGNLSVTSTGAITDPGALTVTGTSLFKTTAGNAAITVDNGGNALTGTITLKPNGTGSVTLVNTKPTTLAAMTLSGAATLTVTTTGAGSTIAQSGPITTGTGLASFTATGAITLTDPGNNFGPSGVSLNNSGANNVQLVNSGATLLAASTGIGGNLSVTSGGDITESGAQTVNGTTTLAVTAATSNILLSSQANDFVGAVGLGGTQTKIQDIALRNTDVAATAPTLSGATNLRNLTLQFDNAGMTLGAFQASGTATITAGGAISQSGAAQVTGTSSFSAGANTITLTNAGNRFTGAVTLSTTDNTGGEAQLNNTVATNLAASTIGTGGAGDLTLTSSAGTSFSGASTIAGNLSVTASGAISQSVGATLTVGGTTGLTAGPGTITLNEANSFGATITLSNSGGRAVSLTNTAAGGTDLGLSNILGATGSLTVTSTNAITNSGALTVDGTSSFATTSGNQSVTINNASNKLSGTVTLAPNGTGSATLDNTVLTTLGGMTLSGAGTLSVTTTSGGIAQAGTITTGTGLATFTATAGAGGPITLNLANSFGSGGVALNNSGNNNVQLNNNAALNLATSSVGTGTLTVTTTGVGSTISQLGGTTITQAALAGKASFNAGANAITLFNAGNSFTGSVKLTNTAGDVQLQNGGALSLDNVSVGTGILTVQAGGAITQAVGATIAQAAGAGTASFNAGANAITLFNAGNSFTGSVGLTNTAGAVQLKNGGALTLDNVSVGTGTLTVQAGSAITQAGGTTIVQAAGASTASFNAGAGTIALTQAGNTVTGAVTLTTTNTSATAAQLTNSTATNIGGSTIGTAGLGGDLTVTSGGATSFSAASTVNGNLTVNSASGAVTQAAQLTVGGTTTVSAGASTVTLTQAANRFTGAVRLTTSNTAAPAVQLTNSIATNLGASTVGSAGLGGGLTVSSAGAITNSGALVVNGASSFTTTAGGAAITLNNAGNQLTGAVTLAPHTTAAVALTNSIATNLAASTIGAGGLSVTEAGAGGAVTQSGVLTVTGATTVTAGANQINLNLANQLSGVVSLNNSGGNPVNLVNAAAGGTNLGASSILGGAGSLTVSSTGAITTSGALVVNGASSFTTTAGGAAITLSNVGNQLGGAVTVAPDTTGAVVLTNSIATSLGASTIGAGGLSLTEAGAGGGVTQTGALTVTGATTINAGANSITLGSANALTGAVSLTTTGANNATLSNSIATNLGASTIGGNLTVAISSAGAAITQSGALTVGGATSINAQSGQITLTMGANALTGPVALFTTGANNANLTNGIATNLAASNVGGNLTVSSVGAITNSGVLTVAGTSSFATTAGNAPINVDVSGNHLTGAILLAPNGAGSATLVNALPTTLTGTTIGGNLTVTAQGSSLTEAGPLTVGGASSFNAGLGISLTDPGNSFTGQVSVANGGGAPISLTASTLRLGASTAAGNLTLTTDNLTAGGAVTVAGTLTIQPKSAGTNIQLAGPGGFGGLDLNAALLNQLHYAALVVGSAGMTGTISTGGAHASPNNANLTLLAGGGGGRIQVNNAITMNGSGALTLTANQNVVVLAGLVGGGGGITMTGGAAIAPITIGAGVTSSGGPISIMSDLSLFGGAALFTNIGAPAGANIHFFGKVDGPSGFLQFAAGTSGNVTFDGAVGGAGALSSVTVFGANVVSSNGPAFNVNNLTITAQNILGTYNPTNTTSTFYPIPFTFNAPSMNAHGTVNGVGGAAAASMIASPYDVNPTFTQFFNGVSVGPLPPVPPAPPPPAPPPTSPLATLSPDAALAAVTNASVVVRQINIVPPQDQNGIGFAGDVGGGGFEVSISAHNVDWDEPVADLPIKPQDYLVDLEEFFSGKRAR
jgi:filamentous hemagglutinin family protein